MLPRFQVTNFNGQDTLKVEAEAFDTHGDNSEMVTLYCESGALHFHFSLSLYAARELAGQLTACADALLEVTK